MRMKRNSTQLINGVLLARHTLSIREIKSIIIIAYSFSTV